MLKLVTVRTHEYSAAVSNSKLIIISDATNKFPHTAIVDLDTYLDHEYKVVRKLTFTTGLQHT